MTYQVLARKWRPKTFDQVVGQGHVTLALQNSLKLKKLAHAFLFTGTRGVGKTSIARIFAKAIRCEQKVDGINPCLICSSCKEIDEGSGLDYREIDGASHNSVDNVRDLIEGLQYLPATGTYKIYVIDEVHMLSVSAFNTLLKTLEEPPKHVIFIFATTEPHKLLGTILSRCQRFDLKQVAAKEIFNHLKEICSKEGVVFSSEELLKTLSNEAKGSIRDGLSLLDQIVSLSAGEKIDSKIFYSALGLPSSEVICELYTDILDGKLEEVSKCYHQLISENGDPQKILYQLMDVVYESILDVENNLIERSLYFQKCILKGEIDFAELYWIYESLSKDALWIFGNPMAVKSLELSLHKVTVRRKLLSPRKTQKTGEVKVEKKPEVKKVAPELVESVPATFSYEEFIQYVHSQSPLLGVHLEQGNLLDKPVMTATVAKIRVTYNEENQLSFDALSDNENKKKLNEFLSQYLKRSVEIVEVSVTQLETSKPDFKSLAQEKAEQEARRKDQKKESFLNNPLIKEAEKLFNAKIDKIILKEEFSTKDSR